MTIKQNKLINGLGIAVAFLICGLGIFQCTNTKDIAYNCQEQSLDVWTTEFISNMKAGQLPDVADKLAESKSASLYAQCIGDGVKSISTN
jgi:hypothetical protein